MKLARRLTVAIVLGMCIVIAIQGYSRLEREEARFAEDTRRYHEFLGNTLGSAVAATWRADGERRALDLVANANAGESQIDIRWVWASGGDLPAERLDRADLASLGRGETVAFQDWKADDGGRAYTYVPVRVAGGPLGALEISEPLAGQRRYLRTTLWRLLGFTLAMVLLAALIASVLGVWIVGRPMRLLVEKARRVGAGDLGGPLELRQPDEIGELAREMNAMCERLRDALLRVQAETSARHETLEQLRHADRLGTVGRIASGIAHELGTPLNVVHGRARMIATGEAAGTEAVGSARVILEQSERMIQAIRQLLDFARRRTPERVRTDLTSIVSHTLALLRPIAERKRVTLSLDAPGPSPSVEVDAGQIQQALTNLVVNGIQAMPKGGRLTLAVRRDERAHPGGAGGASPRTGARVDVEDQGEGIPGDALERIFEPFFTTKPAGEGTGLGLSVAEGIVREHGGWIEVASRPGQGTRFSVYLPEAGPEAGPP